MSLKKKIFAYKGQKGFTCKKRDSLLLKKENGKK